MRTFVQSVVAVIGFAGLSGPAVSGAERAALKTGSAEEARIIDELQGKLPSVVASFEKKEAFTKAATLTKEALPKMRNLERTTVRLLATLLLLEKELPPTSEDKKAIQAALREHEQALKECRSLSRSLQYILAAPKESGLEAASPESRKRISEDLLQAKKVIDQLLSKEIHSGLEKIQRTADKTWSLHQIGTTPSFARHYALTMPDLLTEEDKKNSGDPAWEDLKNIRDTLVRYWTPFERAAISLDSLQRLQEEAGRRVPSRGEKQARPPSTETEKTPEGRQAEEEEAFYV